jgi:hypothetical protein
VNDHVRPIGSVTDVKRCAAWVKVSCRPVGSVTAVRSRAGVGECRRQAISIAVANQASRRIEGERSPSSISRKDEVPGPVSCQRREHAWWGAVGPIAVREELHLRAIFLSDHDIAGGRIDSKAHGIRISPAVSKRTPPYSTFVEE